MLLTLVPDFSKTYQYDFPPESCKEMELFWKVDPARPFEELILSWNGLRPKKGKWIFWVSVRQNDWSPWIQYAEWTSHTQKTFKHAPQGCKIESYQDAIYPKDGECDAFHIKVCAEEGSDFSELKTLYACVSTPSQLKPTLPHIPLPSILLANVPRQSQFKVNHPRAQDLCSPTSMATAINYLLNAKKVDPAVFAAKIYDEGFNIFGNWILNTAAAYQELEEKFRCHVERLPSFVSLHSYLMRGLPVVVSVRGPLPGSALPLTFGHLICVIGYEAKEQKVLCIDSGFAENEQTFVSYALQDFLTAWAKRQNISYLFNPKTLESTLNHMMRT